MTHELVIRGGSVVDGTGAPAMTADGAPGDDDEPTGVRPGGLVRF